MDFTMSFSLFFLLLLVPATSARYMSGGAVETKAGIMPMDGVSPAPTEAPSLNGIPNELRKRAAAPINWCGLIDSNPQDILSCGPFSSCVLKNDFYIACCTNLYTDLCFNTLVLPTTCFDYNTYTRYSTIGSLTKACSSRNYPYCYKLTSFGLSPQYGCAATSFPRTHSLLPIAAYYSSLSTTPQTTFPYSYPPQTPTTTTTHSRTPTPIIDNDSGKFKLPKSAKAGIGSAVGLVALAVIAVLCFFFRRRRNRAHASPTDGGVEPAMVQINDTPKNDQSAAQILQQQYQAQPQGYQGAALPVQQQYQPQPQGYQNATQHYQPQFDNTTFSDSGDSPPYYPAPVYSSGSQQTSAHPIPPSEPTGDPKIASNYPTSTIPPALPLSPNLHQQQHDPTPPWANPHDSPISTINPERSDLHHQDIPPTHTEMGGGKAGVQNHQTGTPRNHSELGAGADHSNLPRNHSELSSVEEARAPYPGHPNNNNRSELGL